MNAYDETVRHVVENFPLFGFRDAETAMFQCIKELLDNSLDSLRDDSRLTGVQSDIKIHLQGIQYLPQQFLDYFYMQSDRLIHDHFRSTGHDSCNSFILLEVDDNGTCE